MGKKFILDTNVILHDSSCIYNFDEHDIFIPMIVLEELDTFKEGRHTVNYQARIFIQELSSLSAAKMLNGGMSLGEGKGKLSIRLDSTIDNCFKLVFHNVETNDHYILNHLKVIADEFPEDEVILVTKDVNLRMKACAFGLHAQDYKTDAVEEPSYAGYEIIDECAVEIIDNLCSVHGVSSVEGLDKDFISNQYVVLRNGSLSVLARYDKGYGKLIRIQKANAFGITAKNLEQLFALHALLDDNIPLVSITGKAGTGKTLLALAAALEVRRNYRQILVTRPIVALSNKDIGTLPGTIDDKIGPYMTPLFDNLGVIRGQFDEKHQMAQIITRIIDEKKLEIEPLAYIRGRSLVKMYMIIDESQNLTPHEVKTVITRAGEGTKMIFTGDVDQIDHPYLDKHTNGLSYMIAKMKNQPLHAHITLRRGERSALSDLASDLL
jgi:PhoH-like ATPase